MLYRSKTTCNDTKEKYFSDKVDKYVSVGDTKLLHKIANKLLVNQHIQQDDTYLNRVDKISDNISHFYYSRARCTTRQKIGSF